MVSSLKLNKNPEYTAELRVKCGNSKTLACKLCSVVSKTMVRASYRIEKRDLANVVEAEGELPMVASFPIELWLVAGVAAAVRCRSLEDALVCAIGALSLELSWSKTLNMTMDK